MEIAGDQAHELKEIPGNSGPPLIGYGIRIITRLDSFLQERYDRYGEISWHNAFGMKVVMLMGPDANQFVFQNRGDLFASSGWELLIGRFFHRGLMLLDGEEHRLHRRIMQSAFTRESLLQYLDILTPNITQGIAAWQPGDQFKIYDHLKSLTLDLASEVFIGHKAGSDAEKINRAFLDAVRAGTGIVRLPLPGTRWKRGLDGRKLLEELFRRELPEKKSSQANDLFSKLCQATGEDGERFSDEDIINHIIFVLMAAHDTSTITLTNMIYQLAKHPEWQDRLRQESQALSTATPSFDQLEALQTMGLVMKEALRLCAPVPGIPRLTMKDTEFKGYRIPKGSNVGLSVWFAHSSALYWNEPKKFDPERFSEDRAEDKKHPFQWVPFGGGAHKCIGLFLGEMQIKAILHQMLLKYRWSVPEGYEMKQNFTSLPIPKDRLPVKLEAL